MWRPLLLLLTMILVLNARELTTFVIKYYRFLIFSHLIEVDHQLIGTYGVKRSEKEGCKERISGR